MKMRTIIPGTIPTRDLHQFLLGSVAPRPIAFVSTLSKDGTSNLAPYSFFNIFSSNPPIAVFSSNRRVVDNTTKDTLQNIRDTGEAVINAVSYPIVRQMAVASIQWPPDADEFEKSGLTPLPSELVGPYRVKESPAQMECRVKDVITLGEHGGAGHLIICEILRIHISEDTIDEKGRINPHKMDLMGRMGRAYYVRSSGEAIHTIVQPVTKLSIGFDGLPPSVRNSSVLSGNDLGLLSGMNFWPTPQEADMLRETDERVRKALASEDKVHELHRYAKEQLARLNTDFAAQILQLADQL